MNVSQIPILVSQIDDNWFVARSIDGPEVSATGKTVSESIDQVTRYLKAAARRPEDHYWPPPKTHDLHQQSVRVRLYYRDGKRRFPASRPLSLQIEYVLAQHAEGSLECFLPAISDVFHCPDKQELETLIGEAIRNATAAMTPQQVLSLLPHAASELVTVRVRLEQRRHDSATWRLGPLESVSEPLGVRSRRSPQQTAWFRDDEVTELMLRLSQPGSTLLLGDAGCGKSTVLQAAALPYRNQTQRADPHEPLPPSLVWATSAGNLIAGMQYLGEWEERLEEIIAVLADFRGILAVDSLADLMRLGGSDPSGSLAAFLLPYLVRGELKMVAEATPEQLAACRRLMPGFAEAFRIQKIDTLPPATVRQIADRLLSDAQRSFGIPSDPATAEVSTRLFARFLPYQTPPRGVVQLLREVIGETRQRGEQPLPMLTPGRIIEKFTAQTGLPPRIANDAEPLSERTVTEYFQRQIIGQPEAVQAAVNTVLRLKTGLCDPKRPIATLFFCGPTGVGKTQLARSLADYLLAGRTDGGRLIRLDMSEYGGYDAIERLLMSPDGEPAQWIQRLRTWPLGVILLDEFEKAAPEVYDCLLTALDEGRITDRFGRTTTLCGTVMIMTSNVGARSTQPLGFTNQNDQGASYQRALNHTFRPEFLNRIDQVVTFQPLYKDTIRTIIRQELTALSNREAIQNHGVKLNWDDSVVDQLMRLGFDPALGARPLQRAIESKLVAPLSRKLILAPETDQIDLGDLLAENDPASY